MGILKNNGVDSVKHVPWGALFIFISLDATSWILTFLTWNAKGPARWYEIDNKNSGIERLVIKNQLPIALMFTSFLVTVVARVISTSTRDDVLRLLGDAGVLLSLTIFVLSALGMITTFLFDFPRFFIAPPFRQLE